MRALHIAWNTVRGWFRPASLDRELVEELRFHLDRQIAENLAAGMSPERARHAAHLTLGGVEQIAESARAARPGALARQLARDVSYGARVLRRTPAFAAAAVGIVALGIGSVAAIFSVVHGVLLRPLPYAEPDRLVAIWSVVPRLDLPRALVNAADHRDWRAANRTLEDIALVRPVANFNLTGAGEPERLLGARVSSNLFPVLGVQAAIGRTFTEDEDEIGRQRVVILSNGLWRRRFGADPSIVGRAVRLSGVPYTVVGIMGPAFQYPGREFQLWTPLQINPAELAREVPGYNYLAVGRLRPGVRLEQARGDLDTIARRLAATYPESNRDTRVEIVPMLDDIVRTVRPALRVLLAAVACLLLIACFNLAGLLGARATTRATEFAVRSALGASRGRLLLQALAEVTPILAAGGALGIAGATWAVGALKALAPPALPRLDDIAVSGPVVAWSLALLALTGLVAGLAPAAQAWRSDLTTATRQGGRSSTGGRERSRFRALLVVAQIALAVPLVFGATLLVRSFAALTRVDPGFRTENVLALHLAIPRSKYETDPQVAAVCERMLDSVRSIPGVRSAGMVNRLPLGGVAQLGFIELEGTGAETVQLPSADWRSVTPGYFDALGIPLIEGRSFSHRDDERAPLVGIVDERIASTIWPGQRVVGKRFRIPVDDAPWVEIVGVVGHIRNDGLDVDTRPQVYWPFRQRTQDRMALVVRGHHGVGGLAPAIVGRIRDIDPEQPVYDVRTMEQVLDRSLTERRLNTMLLTAFAGASLLLAAIGAYGAMAFRAASRVREFGIRLALGATPRAVSALVIRQGLTIAAAGIALGVGGSMLVAGVMQTLVFELRPRDGLSVAAACSVLFAATLLATVIPARRAATVDPALTLRTE